MLDSSETTIRRTTVRRRRSSSQFHLSRTQIRDDNAELISVSEETNTTKKKYRTRIIWNSEFGKKSSITEEQISEESVRIKERNQEGIEKRSGRILCQNGIEIDQSAASTVDQSENAISLQACSNQMSASFASARFGCAKSYKYRRPLLMGIHFIYDFYRDIINKRKMPKTKTTERKQRQVFVCSRCARQFAQKANLRRHLGLIHEIDRDGQPIDEATRGNMRNYKKNEINHLDPRNLYDSSTALKCCDT